MANNRPCAPSSNSSCRFRFRACPKTTSRGAIGAMNGSKKPSTSPNRRFPSDSGTISKHESPSSRRCDATKRHNGCEHKAYRPPSLATKHKAFHRPTTPTTPTDASSLTPPPTTNAKPGSAPSAPPMPPRNHSPLQTSKTSDVRAKACSPWPTTRPCK